MKRRSGPYANAATSERIADGIMHTLGLIAALTGAIWLIVWATGHGSTGQIWSLSIYGAALIATFAASAFYHLTPWRGIQPFLRRIDHAAIFFKIAGTYTPLVVMIGSAFSYAVLGIVWALAAFGIVLKVFFWQRPGWFSTALYLTMGWLSLALVWSVVPILPWASTALIALGGLLYTSGVIFYQSEKIKFSTAIWHGFVIAASSCFFAAIFIGALAQS